MNPEKYQKAKELFWQAKELAPPERESFLSDACGGDPDLYAEIERLLAAAVETPDSFLEPPTRTDQSAAIEIGQEIGHYRILSELGKGGMGEVYRAEDSTLKREVALKVLPADLAGDPHRLERFQREAETIAALNHPNIVTIYSVEQDQDLRFLTMELVDGESLDQTLSGGGLPLNEVVDLGSSLADALAAAHEKGIVHRDLKPANVMLPRQGGIKVLDFGLAKVSAADEVEDTEAATRLATLTKEGVVVGTAAYMSPEQAQGKPVDTRSDIFSFGCLLYEAATGTRPFQGRSSIDILHQIIHEEPAALGERLPEAPLQLQWILRKALAKKPEERYQSARDLVVDLKTLKRDLESHSDTLAVTTASAALPAAIGTKPTSRWPMAAVVGVALLAIVIAIWALSQKGQESTDAQRPAAALSLQRLTASGKVTTAAISPDGNFFAYVQTSEGVGQTLNLRQISKGQGLQLVPLQRVGYWGLRFAPDGSEILYATKSGGDPTGILYRISTLGGLPQKVDLEGIDSQIAVSPDGTRLAWYRSQYPQADQSSLVVAKTDGSEIRTLVTVTKPELLAPLFFTGPSWSPDGQRIAVSVGSAEGGLKSRLAVYGANTGDLEWTSQANWFRAAQTSWLRDGTGILLIARAGLQGTDQIWHVPYPEGTPRLVTNDLLTYRLITLSADGESLLTVGAKTTSDMWVAPRDSSAPPRKISTGDGDGYFGFTFTSDGRIVYPTSNAGQLDLAIMGADGTNSTLLTSSDVDETWPKVTPDGRIVYLARTPAGADVRKMDIDGGNQQTLATATGSIMTMFDISPDGEWVIYEDSITGFPTLWRVPFEGGMPEQLTTYESERIAISPDSSRIAFYYRDSIDSPRQIGIAPIAGGDVEVTLQQPGYFARSFIRWTAGGESLLINSVQDDRANLWRLPLDGGEPERLTDFDEPRLSWVAFHPDGETMVFNRTKWSRDAILIKNFH